MQRSCAGRPGGGAVGVVGTRCGGRRRCRRLLRSGRGRHESLRYRHGRRWWRDRGRHDRGSGYRRGRVGGPGRRRGRRFAESRGRRRMHGGGDRRSTPAGCGPEGNSRDQEDGGGAVSRCCSHDVPCSGELTRSSVDPNGSLPRRSDRVPPMIRRTDAVLQSRRALMVSTFGLVTRHDSTAPDPG